MNNDEETLLMQVDELHDYLVNELDKVKDKEPEEVLHLSPLISYRTIAADFSSVYFMAAM